MHSSVAISSSKVEQAPGVTTSSSVYKPNMLIKKKTKKEDDKGDIITSENNSSHMESRPNLFQKDGS